jgi:hypothetical protein
MALRHHDHSGKAREGRMLDALQRQLVGHEAEIRDAHGHAVAHVLRAQHLQRHLRPCAFAALRLQSRQCPRHEAEPEGRIAAELELVDAEVAQAAQPVLDGVHADEHALHLRPERMRLRRGDQPRADALEQHHAGLGLQALEGLADGGLGHLKLTRGLARGAAAHQRPKGLDLGEAH